MIGGLGQRVGGIYKEGWHPWEPLEVEFDFVTAWILDAEARSQGKLHFPAWLQEDLGFRMHTFVRVYHFYTSYNAAVAPERKTDLF